MKSKKLVKITNREVRKFQKCLDEIYESAPNVYMLLIDSGVDSLIAEKAQELVRNAYLDFSQKITDGLLNNANNVAIKLSDNLQTLSLAAYDMADLMDVEL